MTNTLEAVADPVVGMVEAAATGDEEAWANLVARFTPMLRSVVRRYRLGSADVDDVVQECWVRLAAHIHELRSPGCVAAWLATAARRLAVEMLREAGHSSWLAEGLERADGAPLPVDLAVRKDTAARVRAALERLPERDCLLLSALSIDDRPSYTRISSLLGVPVGSIGPTRARALRRLEQELALEGLSA